MEMMFPRDDECGWEVTFNEYEEVEWNHTCEYCGRGFDTKGGLIILIGAHCKVARGLYGNRWEVDRVVDVLSMCEVNLTKGSTVSGATVTKRKTTSGRTEGTSKTEESTQSTPSGRRKTSSRGTSLLGSMGKFVAGTVARTGRSQELYSSPKRLSKPTTGANGRLQVVQEQGRKDW